MTFLHISRCRLECHGAMPSDLEKFTCKCRFLKQGPPMSDFSHKPLSPQGLPFHLYPLKNGLNSKIILFGGLREQETLKQQHRASCRQQQRASCRQRKRAGECASTICFLSYFSLALHFAKFCPGPALPVFQCGQCKCFSQKHQCADHWCVRMCCNPLRANVLQPSSSSFSTSLSLSHRRC